MIGAVVWGLLLATYTGVLIGATAVPAWHKHHLLLPMHFGIAGLGALPPAAIAKCAVTMRATLNAIGFYAAVSANRDRAF